MKQQKFLLTDLNSSNIGCEIIIRGTVKFLRQNIDPDCEILLPTKTYSYDKKLFADIQKFRVVKTNKFKSLVRFCLRKADKFVSHYTPRIRSSIFLQSSLIVSVGGDIYDVRNVLPIDHIGYELYSTRNNIEIIMFGANMEGFDKLTLDQRRAMILHLNRFQKIYVRDPDALRYLKDFGVSSKIFFYPDPIFQLRKTIIYKFPKKIKKIGINFSPFLLRAESEEKNRILLNFALSIESLIDNGYSVTLFPHVTDKNQLKNLDDRQAIKQLVQCIKYSYHNAIEIINTRLNFYSSKAVIDQFDVVIGARMHACLNSFTLGKPTIFIAYGKKAYSMVRWIKTNNHFKSVKNFVVCRDYRNISKTSLLQDILVFENELQSLESMKYTVDISNYLKELYLNSLTK